MGVTPTLQATPFADPDSGDTQSASQWQVLRVSDASIVFDSGMDATDLATLTIPGGALDFATTYQWQVRYEDNHGAWSNYSAPAVFTTLPANQAPTVGIPAAASTNPVTGKTVALSVFGADDGGETNLTYTWSVTSKPNGAADPTFSTNIANGAKNTTATSSRPEITNSPSPSLIRET